MGISSTSTAELDVEKIVVGGMRRAGIFGVTNAQAGQQYDKMLEHGRQQLEVLVDAVQAEGAIVTSVDRYSLTTVASQAGYAMPSQTLDVLGMGTYLESGSTSGESAIRPITREEYVLIPNKTSEGTPHLYYAERLMTITVYFWPVPDAVGTIVLQRQKLLADVSKTTNTIEFERHWVNYFEWALGHEFAMSMNRSMDRVRHCRDEANKAKKIALRKSRQNPPTHFHHAHASGVYWRR